MVLKMMHKTKAALQSCQCHYEKPKQIKHTRVNAGGQRVTAPVITGTQPMAQLGIASSILRRGMSKSGHSRKGYVNFSAYLQTTQKLGYSGYQPLAHTPFPQIWGELDQRDGCTVMPNSPEKSRSFERYLNSGYRCDDCYYGPHRSYKNSFSKISRCSDVSNRLNFVHFFSSSLAFLRRRRLISPWTAALINWPVLSPGSLSCSIPSISSWAILAVTDCDFEFFGPVAISMLHCNWCKTIYTKFRALKVLTCKTPLIYLVSYTLSCNGAETAKPGSGGTLAGPLTTNVIKSNEAAMKDHTTHPQGRNNYTWRFLALNRHDKKSKPCRLSIEAATELEARRRLAPHFTLSFAARLPVTEVRHA